MKYTKVVNEDTKIIADDIVIDKLKCFKNKTVLITGTSGMLCSLIFTIDASLLSVINDMQLVEINEEKCPPPSSFIWSNKKVFNLLNIFISEIKTYNVLISDIKNGGGVIFIFIIKLELKQFFASLPFF